MPPVHSLPSKPNPRSLSCASSQAKLTPQEMADVEVKCDCLTEAACVEPAEVVPQKRAEQAATAVNTTGTAVVGT